MKEPSAEEIGQAMLDLRKNGVAAPFHEIANMVCRFNLTALPQALLHGYTNGNGTK